MPGSLDRIRKSMTVEPTSRDKGLALILRVTAYDNGMVEVDGIPINASPKYDAVDGWLGAAEIVVTTLGDIETPTRSRGLRFVAAGGVVGLRRGGAG